MMSVFGLKYFKSKGDGLQSDHQRGSHIVPPVEHRRNVCNSCLGNPEGRRSQQPASVASKEKKLSVCWEGTVLPSASRSEVHGTQGPVGEPTAVWQTLPTVACNESQSSTTTSHGMWAQPVICFSLTEYGKGVWMSFPWWCYSVWKSVRMSLPRLDKDDEMVTPIVTSHHIRLSLQTG